MKKYIAIPKNGEWTPRKNSACRKLGFAWDGNDMSTWAESKPRAPWGCRVKLYKSPAPGKGMGVAIGIAIGTHDEFGRSLPARRAGSAWGE